MTDTKPTLAEQIEHQIGICYATPSEYERAKLASLEELAALSQPTEPVACWQYYYRVNDCEASDFASPDCVCWHNEGTGPRPNEKKDDENKSVIWRFLKTAPVSGVRDLSGLPMIIAGALFDFAGYLTTRPIAVKYGASEPSGRIIDALEQWAASRNLVLDDAAVQSWQEHITRAADQVNAEVKS
jgi:hypothetical protein